MKKVWYFVKLGIAGITPKDLVNKIRYCVNKMTANPAYMAPNPIPDPSLGEVTAAVDKLEAAEQAYVFNGGRVAKDLRDVAFQEAKDIFHLMGGYVQLASGSDLETILSAGLEVESKPMPKPAPLAPTNVRAIATKVLGQIIVLFGGSKGRRVYKVYQTEGDPSLETGWELIAETGKVRVVVDGLDRFKTYSFRVVAEGVAGVSVPSDAASATAA
ncbi:MAG: fibronectin type III domain-containing protein [Flavobacteriales bacterium]|nr:fibronectin type III domain-containing protein [Flavobacteriales bacterium]